MICRVLDKFHLPKLKGICALVLFPLCRVDSFFSLVSFLQIKYVNQEEMTTLYNVRVVAKAPQAAPSVPSQHPTPASAYTLCLSLLKSSSRPVRRMTEAVDYGGVYCNTRPTFSESIAGHLQLNK